MMQQVDVPVKAILGEVLRPALLRRWLVAQGDRVSRRTPNGRNWVGLYLEYAAPDVDGNSDEGDPVIDGIGGWEEAFWDWQYDRYQSVGWITAAEAVAALDAIVAREVVQDG